MHRRQVGLLVFPEVEILDVCGPFEVLAAVRLDESRRREDPGPYEVRLVAGSLDPVRAHGGLRFLPDVTLADCPALDLLILPGGWGVRREIEDLALLAWIRDRAARTPLLASVCTGALLLARAGLLDGRRATTHWKVLDWLRQEAPSTVVHDDVRVVDEGDLLTSGGVAAGLDLALRIVARHHGAAIAQATARHIEYPHHDPDATV